MRDASNWRKKVFILTYLFKKRVDSINGKDNSDEILSMIMFYWQITKIFSLINFLYFYFLLYYNEKEILDFGIYRGLYALEYF